MQRKRLRLVLLSTIAAALFIAGAFRLVTSDGLSNAGNSVRLPPAFQNLHAGMTAMEVEAAVGRAEEKTTNAKFERRSDREWDSLQRTVDSSVSDSTADSLEIARARAALAHRAKEVWKYEPEFGKYVLVSFDGDGKVVRIASGRNIIPKPTN